MSGGLPTFRDDFNRQCQWREIPATDTIEGVDFDAEVKCDGQTFEVGVRVACEHRAMFMSRGHGCKAITQFKCFDCYIAWLNAAVATLQKWGTIRCADCHKLFANHHAFSSYWPI